MARKKIPNSSDHPYHIFARCINKDWFSLPLEEVWEIMSHYLFFLHHGFNVKIHSFVLMANHFHLLATFPYGNMSESMRYFMGETSRRITCQGQRINQTYGSRFGRCLISSYWYYMHAYKYIYRNPVKANICLRVEDYQFSTLSGLLGKHQLIIPIVEDLLLFSNPEENLAWLNTSPDQKNEEIVGIGLKKSVFSLPRDPKNSKSHFLELNKL